MSTFSLEDFYLQQVHDSLKKNKYSSSSWERIREKSSTWSCYIYSENEFIGKLVFTFRFDFNNERLIPLIVDIDFDTQKNYKMAAAQPPFSIYAKIIGEDLDISDPRLEVEKIYYG